MRSACNSALVVVALALVLLPPGRAEPPSHRDVRGDALPPGAVGRLGTIRLRHDAGVSSLAFFPCGKKLASAGYDETLRLWALPRGQLVLLIRTEKVGS